jgi:brefeldin A-resistance guanine nucleotide exchange factor 1
LTPVQDLLDRKTRKRLVLQAAKLFNESPKKGIQFLLDNGLVEPNKEGDIKSSLSHFLKSTQQLDKKVLGEYLGKPDNLDTLKVYMNQFNFKEVSLFICYIKDPFFFFFLIQT